MQQYEVELRTLLTKAQYQDLKQHFESIAIGEVDNAETYTFLTAHVNIKVKNLISKGKAKITVKKGAEYQQNVDETELPIEPEYVDQAVKLITALGYEKHIPSMQQRINYVVGDIVVSLKYETNWKYHIEAELVVTDEKEIPEAKKKLHRFFKDLGITPMTEEETKKLVNSVLKKYDIDLI